MRNPHCIVMLRPWVNVGNVGAIVLGRLARLTFAREIGRLVRPSRFYDYTRYRPEIKIVKKQRVVKVPNTSVMAGRRPDEPDFLLLQMMEPHMNAEDFNDSVLALLRELGVSRYVLVGGMYDSVPHTRPLRVTGSARGWTPPPEFSGVRIGSSNYQGPTSLTSQLTDRARQEVGVETLSLIVHLPLYLKLDDDYAGAAPTLKVLSSHTIWEGVAGDCHGRPAVRPGRQRNVEQHPTSGTRKAIRKRIRPGVEATRGGKQRMTRWSCRPRSRNSLRTFREVRIQVNPQGLNRAECEPLFGPIRALNSSPLCVWQWPFTSG